jgi:L-ascorbate metabolism protein UlaG (beta-lactamase superfamily)
MQKENTAMIIKITWLGHASVKVEHGPKIIYIDPWNVQGPKADIILITHSHFDHYSDDEIKNLSSADTIIVGPEDVPLAKNKIGPGKSVTVKDMVIEAVPAYNVDKQFHPKENNWVGYILTIGGKRIYHAGDTDRIPEMKELKVDVACLPVGGTFTMDAASAIQAVNDIKPGHVIPIHYGAVAGSKKDAEELLSIKTSQIHVLDPGQSIEI